MDRAGNYGGQAAATERALSESESIAQDFSERAAEIGQLLFRVRTCNDRLTGGAPIGIAKGTAGTDQPPQPRPPLNSLLRNINDDFLHQLKMLSEEVARLESFV